jgi:DNA-binding SARP family transcriptional activator
VGEADQPFHIASAKQRALVALLALDAGRVVSVERLIEGLWGDEAPADAGNALRHHVSRLRTTVGPSLVTQRSGYLLAVQRDEVDALHFARLAGEARAGLRDRPPGAVAATLRSALALWRGAPLEEFLDHDWARREASRLSELHWPPWRIASTSTCRWAYMPTWSRRSGAWSVRIRSGSGCGAS